MIKSTLKRIRAKFGGGNALPAVWKGILAADSGAWKSARTKASGGPKVLLATSLGAYDNGVLLESTLAAALTLRGAEVHVLLCDKALPACQMSKYSKIPPERFAAKGPSDICDNCVQSGRNVYGPLGLTMHGYAGLISPKDAETARSLSLSIKPDEVADYLFEGLAVGEHAMAGTLRYFARGDLKDEPEAAPILRRYLEASLRTVFAARALLRKHKYEVVCFHHGIYVPQGLIGEVCRQEGVRVVNSNPAYRKQTFVFSHGDTYHHTMITEPVSGWENMEWTPAREKRTMDYLKSRWQGTQDWIWFHEDPQGNLAKIQEELGVDFSKPCIGMLTSVMWDAQLHYRANAFPSMLDWVMRTIAHFAKHPDLQLIIRVHPAEVRGMIPSRQKLTDEIARAFPKLPPNVFVIPPESQISTYAVMEQCGSVIIFNTKTGIELSSMGIPVIVAGEAWIRNKGFSIDASSPADYFRILDTLPITKRLEGDQLVRARKYAYHFFYRRMLDFPFIDSKEKFRFGLDVASLADLEPGKAPGLDNICSGILTGSPFVHTADDA
jgi:hypothetical protein